MLEAYRAHVAERAALGIPPLPLSKQQAAELVELLKNPQTQARIQHMLETGKPLRN